MGNILDCAKLYEKLLKKEYVFTLENGFKFSLYFATSNFYHLLGLEKLKDITQLQDKKPNQVYKQILNGRISSSTIENSLYYNKISSRILNFDKLPDLLDFNKSNKIIIDFDTTLLNFDSKLQFTKYILYKRNDVEIVHLTIGLKDKLYPESFFVEFGNTYVSGQTMYDILNIEVIEH